MHGRVRSGWSFPIPYSADPDPTTNAALRHTTLGSVWQYLPVRQDSRLWPQSKKHSMFQCAGTKKPLSNVMSDPIYANYCSMCPLTLKFRPFGIRAYREQLGGASPHGYLDPPEPEGNKPGRASSSTFTPSARISTAPYMVSLEPSLSSFPSSYCARSLRAWNRRVRCEFKKRDELDRLNLPLAISPLRNEPSSPPVNRVRCRVRNRHSYTNLTCFIVDNLMSLVSYTPPIPHSRPALLQAVLTLPPRKTLHLTMDVVKPFLRYTEHQPAAQRAYPQPSWCHSHSGIGTTAQLQLLLSSPAATVIVDGHGVCTHRFCWWTSRPRIVACRTMSLS